ncbi:MAG: hypothetical protein ACHQ50_04940 [Fimbriimonadales bacterium]
MKLLASLGLLLAFGPWAAAKQEIPTNGVTFVRIQVMHGDPWAVKALLEGISFNQPELSTILGFAGVPDKDSDFISSIFGGKGRLVVNPTDNSILFIPEKK